jgi:RNA polymerase-binding transcription factor DksA
MWTVDELGRVREQLVAQLRELEHARAGLAAEVEPRGGPGGDDPAAPPLPAEDLAAHRTEEEVAFRVLAVEDELRTEIADALARLDQNRYGVCERCGGRVAKDRLRALPSARYCMPCAREVKSAG